MKQNVKEEFNKQRYEELSRRESIKASELLELAQAEDAKAKFLERYGADIEFDPKQFSLRGVTALGARINNNAEMGFLPHDHDYRLVYVGDEMDLTNISVPRSKCYDYMFAGLPVTKPAAFPNMGESFEATYFKTPKLVEPGNMPINAKNIESMYAHSGIESAPAMGHCKAIDNGRNAFQGCLDMKTISTLPDNMSDYDAQRMFDRNIVDYAVVEDMKNRDVTRFTHPDEALTERAREEIMLNESELEQEEQEYETV